MSKPIVYVVHCVDTEGPLEETLEATFERLRKEKNIDLQPSLATLNSLQNKNVDLNGQENEIADYLSPARLSYLSTWQALEEMVLKATDLSYRRAHASPDGSPYTFSWFIIDVVGYKDNPRRKAIGFHTVWDQYHRILKNRFYNDIIGWHFHTVPPNQHALHYNTSWSNNDFQEQVLARKVIEKKWFPVLFRAGGVIERNDLSHWLERFIPFDYSNQNNKYAEFGAGSQSDWRHAPMAWGSYNPCFYDYRKEGRMRRHIFRCLDIKTPGCRLDDEEVRNAFQQAKETGVSVLAYTNHDRRDLRPEIEYMHKLITETSKNYPDINWQYVNALTAANHSLDQKEKPPLSLKLSLEKGVLKVSSNQPVFSGDLFLAIEEEGNLFYRDNMTMESSTEWAYFSPRWNSIKNIGVAAVTEEGQSVCEVINL